MKVRHLEKISRGAAIVVLFAGLSGVAYADSTNRPYIKTYGSDVMTGGWYDAGSNCSTDTNSNYQDPSYSNSTLGFTADPRVGGILTFANDSGGNSAGGASSQYGVFAIGQVDGSNAPDGFYGAGAQAAKGATSAKALTFANTISGDWGGAFEGSVRQSNCIPDYYGKIPTDPPPPTISSLTSATGTGIYSASAPANTTFSLTAGDVTIAPGSKITIYVKGDVYIANNIRYAAHDANSIPKFALVVSGSIYIDKSVSQLDGLYIAEPSSTDGSAVGADDGDIWTCHPNNTDRLDYTYPPNCSSPLVVNGALIAKQINLLRVKGDVGSASTGEDNQSTAAACQNNPGSCNVSEVVNYTPEMIMGGGFFTTGGTGPAGSGTTGLPVDSLISLPPVF